MIPISNTSSSTRHTSGSISMAPAQRGTKNQDIGKSRGGLTTKIAALVDALGNLVRFVLLPGERHDITSFDVLMAGIACLALIGDKAFDAHWLRQPGFPRTGIELTRTGCSAIGRGAGIGLATTGLRRVCR